MTKDEFIKLEEEAQENEAKEKAEENWIDEQLHDWSDTELLQNLVKFMDRASVSTIFVQDDDGVIRGQIISLVCGDKVLNSPPVQLMYPMVIKEDEAKPTNDNEIN